MSEGAVFLQAEKKLCRAERFTAFFTYVVIPLTPHKNGGFTELMVVGVRRSIILLFTAFLVGVLKG